MVYALILFDLDDTLMDFGRTQTAAFAATAARFGLDPDGGALYARYQAISKDCWSRHERGLLDRVLLRTERWRLLAEQVGRDDLDSGEVAEAYLDALPEHPYVLDGAEEVCRRLAARAPLGVVTNGFESVQHRRLAATSLARHVSFVLTSEAVGASKPARPLFDEALRRGGAAPADAVMIGDNHGSDITGAHAVGIDTVWFNPSGSARPDGVVPTHSVTRLHELLELPRLAELAAG